MAFTDTPTVSTRGTLIRVGSHDLVGATGIDNFGGGTSNEITISSLASTAVEVATGLQDGGSFTVTGAAVAHSPGMLDLAEANRNAQTRSVLISTGAVPSGKNVTDGSGIVVASGLTASAVPASNAFAVSAVVGGSLPAVTPNDYVQFGANTAKITAINEASTGIITFTLGTASATLTGTTFSIVRPAMKWVVTARISEFSLSATVDEVVRYSITLRATGSYAHTVGTPSVTL